MVSGLLEFSETPSIYIIHRYLEVDKLRCCRLVATLEQWQLRICTTFSPAAPSLSTDFSSGF